MHDVNNAGVVEIITFRAQRTEHPYIESLKALLRGTSTGHVALRITFYNRNLYEMYIANNKGICSRTYTEPNTNKIMYEVYLSFWPEGTWAPWHHLGDMRSYNYDCVQSGNFSGVEYSERGKEYIQPLQRYARSSLPVFKNLSPTIISLPPTIILHSSRLGLAFGDTKNMQPNIDIVNAAESFTKKYHTWRAAMVHQHNATITNPDDINLLQKLNRDVSITQARMKISKKHLKNLMFPNKTLDDDEFTQELEPFISFGYTERDKVSLPLVYNGKATAGIEVEPLLQYIRSIALNHAAFPYHVLFNNCANIVWKALHSGTKKTFFSELKNHFLLPWFVRWFNFTITPTLVLHLAMKIQTTIEKIRTQQAKNSLAILGEVNQPRILVRRNAEYGLNTPITTLNFSKYSSKVADEHGYNELDDDEIPTTKVAFYSKVIRNAYVFLSR